MYIFDEVNLTIGTAHLSEKQSVVIDSLQIVNDVVNSPIISTSNECWTSEINCNFTTLFGGIMGVKIYDTYNEFYLQRAKSSYPDVTVKIAKNSKWNVFFFDCEGSLTVILTNPNLINPTNIVVGDVFTEQTGIISHFAYPMTTSFEYIQFSVNKNLALDLIGRQGDVTGRQPLEIEYPSSQLESAPHYFKPVAYNTTLAHSCVLSMDSRAWSDYPDEFTVFVKSSELRYLFFHVKQGEYIESGYVYDDPTDAVHDDNVIFAKTELSENRKFSVFLYWTVNQLNNLDYLGAGGFIFCFDKDNENNLSYDVDLALQSDYLISDEISNNCNIIHALKDNNIFGRFLLTAPFATTTVGGASDNLILKPLGYWTIEGILTFTMTVGFRVIYPRDIAVDYDSDLWQDDFTLEIPIRDDETVTLTWDKNNKHLVGNTTQYYNGNAAGSHTVDLSIDLSSSLDANNVSYRNPILIFYFNQNYRYGSSSSYDLGHVGIMCVTELPKEYYAENGGEKPSVVPFYDSFDFDDIDFAYPSKSFDAENGIYVKTLDFFSYRFSDGQIPSDRLPQNYDEERSEDTTTNFEPSDRDSNPKTDVIDGTNPSGGESGGGSASGGEYNDSTDDSFNNPEQPDGKPSEPSQEQPNYDNSSDDVELPETPSIAANGALLSLYLISSDNLQKLADFLWTDNFITVCQKYLISNPLDVIISLSYCFVTPTVKNTTQITLHGLSSGASGNLLESQISNVDFGYVDIARNFASFFDYIPKTQINIFLPFIGIRPLDTNLVMGSRLNLTYSFDYLTGSCVAFIRVTKNEHSYLAHTFTGNFLSNLPLTAQNFDNIVNTLSSFITAVMSRHATMAVGSLIQHNAYDTDINQVGSGASVFGAMESKEPYLIITRPSPALTSNYALFKGIPSNISGVIGDFTGFTICRNVLLENIPATNQELELIKVLFSEGVIL